MPGEQQRRQPGGETSQRPEDQAGGQTPSAQDLPGELPEPTPEAVERLADQLQRMAREGDRQQQNAEAARRAREQAEQIAEGLSEEQRQRLEQWAEAIARQRPEVMEELTGGGDPQDQSDSSPRAGDSAGNQDGRAEAPTPAAPIGPRRTELVDARPRDAASRGSERDQVVAEWLAPPGQPGDAGAATSTISPRERMLQAARSAQKAVDDRAIPSRYDRLVQRYFRRLPERIEEQSREAAAGPSGRTIESGSKP